MNQCQMSLKVTLESELFHTKFTPKLGLFAALEFQMRAQTSLIFILSAAIIRAVKQLKRNVIQIQNRIFRLFHYI